jgi:transcriptional regulator with XRE-family HTH domain
MQQTTLELKADSRGTMAQIRPIAPTPLAVFVRERLAELEISQSDFCRRSTFDQGLLSKIQNSLVNSLSIESVLKLAVGLSVPPQQLFHLIDRMDLHDLVMQSYAQEFSAVVTDSLQGESPELAAEVQRIISGASVGAKTPVVRPRRRRWPGENGNGSNTSNIVAELSDDIKPVI